MTRLALLEDVVIKASGIGGVIAKTLGAATDPLGCSFVQAGA